MNRNTWQIRILQLENVMKPGSSPGKQSNQYHTKNSIPDRPTEKQAISRITNCSLSNRHTTLCEPPIKSKFLFG
jgi:hypothetical protein